MIITVHPLYSLYLLIRNVAFVYVLVNYCRYRTVYLITVVYILPIQHHFYTLYFTMLRQMINKTVES